MRGLVKKKESRATWGEEGRDVGSCRWIGIDMLQVPFATMLALEVDIRCGYEARVIGLGEVSCVYTALRDSSSRIRASS